MPVMTMRGEAMLLCYSVFSRLNVTRLERAFMWSGGAMFVASLALCAWWYLVVLARATAARGWAPVAADVLLFTAFGLHHSVFARDRVKRALDAIVPQRLARSVYVWTASVLLILVCALWQPVGGELYDVRGGRAFAHALVQLVGIWLIVQSVRAIDPLELAGIRRSGQSSASDTLQIGGPYRWVRHPVYLGWILAVFGVPHMTGDRFTFAAITSIYLVIAIPWEERSLGRTFARQYEEYRLKVRWRVIPFVY
jgi:protein-S-isoprenylcysteine O-methyltransferase Ste14